MRRTLVAGIAAATIATLAALPTSPVTAAGGGSATASPTASAAKKSKCHPSYRGRCLKRNASDYDCAGGSGNGPYYVSGPFRVVGSDPFRLDSDRDGIACE
jgi:hypothetical protein